MSGVVGHAGLLLAGAGAVTALPWDSVNKGPGITLSNSDLTASSFQSHSVARGLTSHGSTGDWYAEITVTSSTSSFEANVGVQTAASNLNGSLGGAGSWCYTTTGWKKSGGSISSYGSAISKNDIIGVRLNAGALSFYKNGVNQGVAYTGVGGTPVFLGWGGDLYINATLSGTINTGQSAFVYLPSGASAWG